MRRGLGLRRLVRSGRVGRALGVSLVAAGLLVVSPIGDALAASVEPSTTSSSSTAPTTSPDDRSTTTTDAPGSTTPDTVGPTTTGTPSTTASSASTTTTSTTAPSTTTSTTSPTTTSTAPALAVSGILGAPNPFDANHGFTLLARRDAQLRGGSTLGAVAVGGDLRFGPYNVSPKPAALLDEIPVGLLVGGGITTKDSEGRLTVGANGRVLVGDLDALSAVPVGRGVAVVPAGGNVNANPQIRAAGPQDVDAVGSPGTFGGAFQGVFADLAQRGRSLAASESTAIVTDPDGNPLGDRSAVDVQVQAPDGTGPVSWSVTGRELARAATVTIDSAPSATRPLVINVDGEGAKVRLDTSVALPAAARAYVVWNVVNAPTVVITRPLPGSLLAPSSTVQIDDDVAGAVIADTVTQTAGTVGTTPFATELPKAPLASDPRSPTTDPTAADPQPGGVPQTVPPATGNNAVITVKVAGDRASTSAVAGLAGVTLQLYDGLGSPSTPVVDSWATCVSDLDGDCSFIVPGTGTPIATNPNRDRRFWVVRTTSPAGWFGLNTLVTGASPPFASTPYQFRTGDQLRNGNTYASSGPNATFMLATGNTNATASGGIWQTSRNNPALPAKCGLNVALVLDVSGSVASSLGSLKTAAKTFTNSLVGTPSQLGLFTFSSTAPANSTNNQNRPLTPVSTQTGADTVNGWIDGLTASGGTNWDRGIYQVAQSANRFDIAIVITDGNPTFYGNQEGPGNYTRFREVENGIFSANAVKAESTRLVAVGVGDGVSGSPNNLISISGPTANSDYFQTTDYTQAGALLRALALGSCQGSVTVIKQIVPSTAPPGSITGAQPAGGWTFGATTTASGVAISPTSGPTASGSGALSFNLTFPGGTTTAPVTVTETQQAGYTLVQQGGFNATCTRLDTNAALTVANSGAAGFSVGAASAYPVSCTVYNRAPAPGATVVVDKNWVINGQSYVEGQQPPDFEAALAIDGSPQDWAVVRTGFQQGATTTLSETVQLSRRQCTLVSSRVTLANGVTVNAALPYSATLAAGANSYAITNTVTCISRLTLVKQVLGAALPTAWNLTATAPAGALPGPSGTTGVTADVTAGARYVLAESGGSPIYKQRADPNAVPIPGSTVSWGCVEIDADGNVIPGFADGLNGGVTMPIGTFVRCTATNETSTLVLEKLVINDSGGTALPSDWQLTATPVAPVFPGLTPVTVTGSTVGVPFDVRPGQAYELTESGPSGYTLVSVNCTISLGSPRAGTTVTLNPGETGTCVFTNDDQQGRLTLIKTVENGTTGATATPANWTLSATGPTPISGTSGAAEVTNAAVDAGTYALAESGGPAGYTASAWTCTGGTVTGSNVAVASGANVTCQITNTAVAPQLTLVKQVDNGSTGATATPAAWTLAAAGPTPLSGTSGTPAVTAVPVQVGTYTLSESGGPAGYTPSTWSCTGVPAVGSTVTLSTGQSATCTIVNTAVAPRLTLIKQVVNSSGGGAVPRDWTLSATGPVTIQGLVGDTSITDAAVRVGTYSLFESGGPSGYTASQWVCTGGASTNPATGTVTLAAGNAATCTITNTDQPARLTLRKVVDAAASGSGRVPADWTLTATPVAITGQGPVSGNGDPTTAGGVNAVSVFSGSYDLSESGPTGFAPGTWVCQGGVLTAARVVVPPGGAVECTITNTAVTPTLTLVKVVDSGTTGATTPPTAWTLTADGPTPISGSTGSAAVTAAPVRVGTYTLSESGPLGYTASAWVCTGGSSSTAASVTLTEGQNATCTITNTAIAPQLTLVKLVDNGATGGTAVATDWTLSATGPITISGRTGEPAVTGAAVQVGAYTLAEAGGPAGYTASAWVCVGGSSGAGTVTLAAGERATCTITNTAIGPTLTLVKVVDNGTTGATATPADWTLAAGGPTPLSGVSGTPAVTGAAVAVGDYDLSESGGPTGYTASDWVCVGAPVTNGTVAIALDQDVTCTITNTAIPPTLTLVKTVSNSAGGTAVPTDWLLSASGGSTTIQGRVGETTVTNAVVPVGTYDLAEAGGPTGYTASTWSCTGGTSSDPAAATVTLGPGAAATCTINNSDQPATLTLVKVVDPAASGSGRVPADWTLTATPVGIPGQDPVSGNGDPASPGGVNAVPVFSGAYDLTEVGPSGFTPGAWVCQGGSVTGAQVVVPAGGVVICTISNTAVSPTLTLVKVVDNGTTGATTPPTAWTLSATGPTPISGATGDATVTAAPVQVGTYNLAESGPTGYTASDWVCTGATSSTATSVTLAEGENGTCTMTNTAIAPQLTLVKQVEGAAAGGTAAPTDWTLTATGPSTITGPTGDPSVTAAVVPVGAFALSESGGPAGYTPSPWSCVGGTSGTNMVTLAPGDQATCTIVNTAVIPTLTLVKLVDNGTTGATTLATAWTLSASGPVSISGTTGSAAVTAAPVQAGQYTLAETGPTGYAAADWVCTGAASSTPTSVTLTEGQSATCTITNTAIGPTLTLEKVVNNLSGGTAVATDWILTATGPTTVTGRMGDASVTDAVVPIGDFQLSESGGPGGYAASVWTCAGNATPVTPGGSVAVGLGENVTCSITNTDQPATLTLQKIVDKGASQSGKVPADWTVTATPVAIQGQATVSGNGDPTSAGGVNAVTVKAGDYDLSESGPTGFVPGTWACQGGVVSQTRVTVPVNGNVICQITNRVIDPRLTLVKVVDNGTTAATAVPTDWTLSAAGPTPISGATGSAAVTNALVAVGTYTLSESGPPGYTAAAWSCVGGTASGSQVTVAEGQAATCTIVNTAVPGVWELTKLANPPSGTTVPTGSVITYTLIAAHESGAPISGASAADDLTQVLPFATVNTPLPAELTMTGNTIAWAIPLIPIGGSVEVSFSVTVNADAGGATIFNLAAPTSPDGHCTPCEATHFVQVGPPTPPTTEPPPLPPSGTEIAGPVRWGALLLLSGCVLLILSLRRRRGPRSA